MPTLLLIFLTMNLGKAKNPEFAKKFGVLYDDYKPLQARYLIFMFAYFQRRFFLAFIIIFLPDYPNF